MVLFGTKYPFLFLQYTIEFKKLGLDKVPSFLCAVIALGFEVESFFAVLLENFEDSSGASIQIVNARLSYVNNKSLVGNTCKFTVP